MFARLRVSVNVLDERKTSGSAAAEQRMQCTRAKDAGRVCMPHRDTGTQRNLVRCSAIDPQSLALLGTAAAGAGLLYYKNADPQVQFDLISSLGPLYRMIDAETTHVLGVKAFQYGMAPVETRPDPAILKTTVWNRQFPNPIGAWACHARAADG